MPLTEIVPSPALRAWVDRIWVRTGSEGGRVLPDGAADIIFAGDETFAFGTMTRPLDVPAGGGDLIGVRFQPGRAATFLEMPLAEITDARVPVRVDLHPQTLERDLLRRLARNDEIDLRVDYAIAMLVRSGGRASIDDVARRAGMTRQHLRRKFLDVVGVSPKFFARVMRFRRVVGSLDAVSSWADAALEHGYVDQSHLIADFRALAGTTPAKFHFSYP